MIEQQIKDPELGPVFLRKDVRARRFNFHIKFDGIHVSMPIWADSADFYKALESLRSRLLQACKEASTQRIDLKFTMNTPFFKLRLLEGKVAHFMINESAELVTIICPLKTPFNDDSVQTFLYRAIEQCLKKKARQKLPARLELLSRKENLPYQSVRINASKSRWGSCSSSKNINLSCYLLLLPLHLIDYVLLHELTHTLEMNHGKHFWELLQTFTQGKAIQLREEIKQYRTDIF